MGNPDDLLDAVRDKLRAIAAVAAITNGSENIESYLDDESNWIAALNGMAEPAILLVLQSSDSGEFEASTHSYEVVAYLRLGDQRFGTFFHTVCSGVPAGGDGQPFHFGQISADFEMIGVPIMRRDQDEDGIEYPAIAMRFRDLNNS